jgi:2-dehydro-3-deoxyphosphogluconate aldolase/(4S)-4-hydroxy-2-oxoglutarate aldolase
MTEIRATVRPAIPEQIRACRVVAIGRSLDSARVPEIAEGLRAAGIRAFELTLNTPSALEAIAALTRRFDPDEILIGAGTVLDIGQARAAVDAGARFLVMPHTDPELIAWAADRSIPTFPGAFTPTEILAAWRAGAAAVKLFPASVAGPAFVREMRGPLPEIPLIPVGGVSVDNAPAFFAAGAIAVGIGSWLTGGGDPATIRERATHLLAALPAALPPAPRPAAVPEPPDRGAR